MSMFNHNGDVNAMSVKDAMAVIAKYASILEENQPSGMALAGQPGLTDGKTDELISRAIFTQDGKVALAQTMPNPIR